MPLLGAPTWRPGLASDPACPFGLPSPHPQHRAVHGLLHPTIPGHRLRVSSELFYAAPGWRLRAGMAACPSPCLRWGLLLQNYCADGPPSRLLRSFAGSCTAARCSSCCAEEATSRWSPSCSARVSMCSCMSGVTHCTMPTGLAACVIGCSLHSRRHACFAPSSSLCFMRNTCSRAHILCSWICPPLSSVHPAVAISVARGMAYLHTRSPPFLHLDLKSAK